MKCNSINMLKNRLCSTFYKRHSVVNLQSHILVSATYHACIYFVINPDPRFLTWPCWNILFRQSVIREDLVNKRVHGKYSKRCIDPKLLLSATAHYENAYHLWAIIDLGPDNDIYVNHLFPLWQSNNSEYQLYKWCTFRDYQAFNTFTKQTDRLPINVLQSNLGQ